MSKYESSVKQIPYKVESVFAKISDLSNLKSFLDRIPADKLEKVKEFHSDADSVSISIDPVGSVTFRIVEREPMKCVKFEAENSPMPLTLWIQVLPTSDTSCKMRVTAGADLNIFIRKMFEKYLQEGVERIAEMLAMIPYE